MGEDNKICDKSDCNCKNVEANFRSWYHGEQDEAEKRRIVSLNNMYAAAKELLKEIEEEIKICTGS